jgi:hypothetical protein
VPNGKIINEYVPKSMRKEEVVAYFEILPQEDGSNSLITATEGHEINTW